MAKNEKFKEELWAEKFLSNAWKEFKKDRRMNVIDLAVIIYLVWRLTNGNPI